MSGASTPITILMVEDSEEDIELTLRGLERAKLQNRIWTVRDGVQALAFLRREAPYQDAPRPDLILLDLNLPKLDGREALARFYRDHFVNSNPKDTRMIPVSRTIGTDRVVDEVLFCFTHDVEIPWMLPGVQPTGKYVEVPLVAIVAFRGDKLYHEHIYWDQASVLAQIGLLDPATLPIAGAETARKLVDETLPSNELMRRVRRE